MILKNIDDKSNEIGILKTLLKASKSEAQRKLIAKDLKAVENGYQAEKDNAYYLDFTFSEREKSTLLHDVRIEHNGRTAQFDHILIATYGIEVLESKSFMGNLNIKEDSSLSVKYGSNTKTFPNPIEQNNRHIEVLKGFLKEYFPMSARFKLTGGVNIRGRVLIHPNTTVINRKLPSGFERSDSYATKRDKEFDTMGVADVFKGAVSLLSQEQVKEIATLLISHHKPITFDYTKKYKISGYAPEAKAKTVKTVEVEVKSEVAKCPRCKEGDLVKRKRKSKKYADKHESNEFMGCSRFPRCKYTQEVV